MPRKKIVSSRMSKRLSFYGLIGLTSVCIFFLVFNQRYSSYIEHRLQPILSDSEIRSRMGKHEDQYILGFASRSNMTYLKIEEIVDQQRRIIHREMENYKFHYEQFGQNISNINDLIMEKGGRPIRSVIIASWRSGSTFMGDIINAHPANFYHYEPLLDFGIIQVRGPPLSNTAISNLYALFNCDYQKLTNYLNFGKTHPWVFNHNTHLWRQCLNHKKICWDPKFATKFCQLFPFQSMKLVRLRLSVAEVFLADKSLGVRMVLLIRDPRGLIQSRKHREWCPSSPDCSDPVRICADMVSDYKTAAKFKKKYPQNFKIVRYEDFSLDPFTYTKDLYEFYGLNFHYNVKNFLETHTKSDLGGVSSTFRNSKVAPFHWRNDLDFDEIEEIQNVCSTAMALWGYSLAFNETHQKNFNPITSYYL